MSRTSCCAPRFLARAIQQINSQGVNSGKCASNACTSDVIGSVSKSDYKLMQKFASSDLYKSIDKEESNKNTSTTP